MAALRLTFGGAPGPFDWSVLSESVCDLAIAILQDECWDPLILHAPIKDLVPPPKLIKDDVPFAEGRELIVDIPVNPRGTADVYIDDTIGLTVDIEESNNIQRLEQAILLAIHCAAREKSPDEPIPREEMAAIAKLIAEAGAEEVKTILGWVFNFRDLTVSLPENKHQAWKRAILDVLERGMTSFKEIEKIVGRLVHLGIVLPSIHHFLSRLRELMRRAKIRRMISMTAIVIEDLKLMIFFLDKAKGGIDMNLLVCRKPTKVYRSDLCPAGLGGYRSDRYA